MRRNFILNMFRLRVWWIFHGVYEFLVTDTDL